MFTDFRAADFDTPPVQPVRYGDWRNSAACSIADAELFFPVPEMVKNRRNEKVPSEIAARAIKICDTCEVRDECLRYALENGMKDGIWGGMTSDQRTALMRRLAKGKRR